MITTEYFSSFNGDAKSLSPLALAFVGDGVFELFVRGSLINKHTLPAKTLHNLSVELVNAAAQAKAYDLILEKLNDTEKDILRRGRNANVKVPKNTSPEEYHKATALEALFGYLFLDNQSQRLAQLFELILSQSTQQSEEKDD